MIDQNLLTYLVDLGTDADARVYLGNAPQDNAYPLVVVRRIGGSQPQTLGGTSLFERSEFSINVFCDNYTDAYPISNAIRDALKNFRGDLSGTTVASTKCTLFPTDQSEIDSDKVTRWVAMTFLFMHA